MRERAGGPVEHGNAFRERHEREFRKRGRWHDENTKRDAHEQRNRRGEHFERNNFRLRIHGRGWNALASLEVGKKATIQIQLAPTSAGTNNGSLTVVSDASNSPLEISLTAIGTESGLTVSPGSVNFGSMKVGQSTTQTVKLTNNGNVDLVVTSAQVTGSGFGMSGLSLPATIPWARACHLPRSSRPARRKE